MSVSAVVLTRDAYAPLGVAGVDETVVHASTISRPIELLAARFDALRKVTTSHCFFLDDDDELPSDFARVLQLCIDAAAAVAYTDRIVRTRRNGQLIEEVVRGEPYSQQAHLRRPQMVHQLAVFETEAVLRAVEELPRGDYCPEMLIGWQVAKQGAAYVPEIGYVWNKGNGLHRRPAAAFSQGAALLWCKNHP